MNRIELVSSISKDLRIPVADVDSIIKSAPFRYRTYTIPKRSGGLREINHPAASLKIVQRWLVEKLLNELRVHRSAMGYVEGLGIFQNAGMHRRSNFFVRYDFRDFFPSISEGVVSRYINAEILANRFNHDLDVVPVVVRLVCYSPKRGFQKRLSIGAPSSPHISNLVMYRFDEELSRAAVSAGVVYTRYADDIYLSSGDRLRLEEFEPVMRRTLDKEAPFVSVNENKIQRMSRRNRVSITGLKISSQRRVSVGRELKRSIRTRIYLALEGKLDSDGVAKLRGHVAYVKGIEPVFVGSLERKYPAFFGGEQGRMADTLL